MSLGVQEDAGATAGVRKRVSAEGRADYLRALGIQEYSARGPLSGAAQSVLRLQDAAALQQRRASAAQPPHSAQSSESSLASVAPLAKTTEQPFNREAAQAGSQPNTGADSAESAATRSKISGAIDAFGLSDSPAKAKAKAESERQAKSEDKDKAADQTLKRAASVQFCLHVHYTDAGLMLVTGGANSKAEFSLARNILLAVSAKADMKHQAKSFRWPLSRNTQMDHGEAAARAALRGVFTAATEKQGALKLLLLGDEAQQWFCESTQTGEASAGDSEAAPVHGFGMAAATLAGPSLEAMLGQDGAGLKASLWQQLKAWRAE